MSPDVNKNKEVAETDSVVARNYVLASELEKLKISSHFNQPIGFTRYFII